MAKIGLRGSIALACIAVFGATTFGEAASSAASDAGLAALRVYACETTGDRIGQEHEVTVHISNIGPRNSREFFALDAKFDAGIRRAHVGEYDGNGIGLDGSGADYFAYGPSAIKLWQTMKAIVAQAAPAPGSYVVLTFGSAGGRNVKTTTCKIEA